MPDSSFDSSSFAAPRRGFAALDPVRRSEIARQGGRAAHERGTAHEFDPVEARAAGFKSRDVSRVRAEEIRAASKAAPDVAIHGGDGDIKGADGAETRLA